MSSFLAVDRIVICLTSNIVTTHKENKPSSIIWFCWGPKSSIIRPFLGGASVLKKAARDTQTFEVWRSICEVWRPTFDVRPPTLNGHCAASGAQRLMSNTCRPLFDVQRWRAAFDVQVAFARHGLQ